ncbi:MarR family transcriptional regulator [Streptomyces sp. GC420]|uniref:MarR family transcriptional regulator n=1 Tax=Streptomyces sp. GC420 TaxID=2697568 RepID=UPI0014151FA1|nr:MarR family transcriptional regulator [Streptomyces sp. GC420]NBM14570.1 MarR family transcriptional regulator [Streptomyces sp. GC420]
MPSATGAVVQGGVVPDIRETLHRAGHGTLCLALEQCRADCATAALEVRGRPGGVFHLRHGNVVAVETAGAPGVEALLLRSGRVSEADWAELPQERAAQGWPGATLVSRGHIGAAELQVVSAMAMRDAVFAVVAGDLADCVTGQEDSPVVQAGPGEDPLQLMDNAVRKLAALAALPQAVLPDRERIVAGPGTGGPAAEGLAPQRREILFLANGRRTPRDIAFALGRSVYNVTVEVSRMLGEGLLERAVRNAGSGVPKVWADQAPVPRRAAAGEREHEDGALPRRIPGASGFMARTLAVRESTASWRELFRFRNGTRSADPGITDP